MAEITTKPKFCTACGNERNPQAKFCAECGLAIDSSGPSPAAQSPSGWNWGWIVAAVLIAINLFNAYVAPKTVRATTSQGSTGAEDQMGKRSVETYLAAKRLFDFSIPAADAALVEKKLFNEYLAASAKQSQHNRQVAGRLRGLNMLGVDGAVTSFVLQSAEGFDFIASYADLNAKLVGALKAYSEDNAGVAPMLEAFARGLMGDPFGKAKELHQDQQRLKAMWEQSIRMREEVLKRFNDLEQLEARLKAQLQAAYPSAWK